MKFKFESRELRKGWVSTYIEVEADSEEEAVQYVIDDDPDHCEVTNTIYHASELELPGKNATWKLFKDGHLVCDNGYGLEKIQEAQDVS